MDKAELFFLTSSIVVASILAIGLVSNLPLASALIVAQELGSAGGGTITEGAANDGNFEPFAPATVNVMPGSTVSWTNGDSTEHTITANDGSFDAGPISPGDTWENTFDSSGVFGYHCSIHPWMTGTVVIN